MNYLYRKIPYLRANTGIISTRITFLKIKVETNLFRGKYRNSLCGLGSGKDFLKGQKKITNLKRK